MIKGQRAGGFNKYVADTLLVWRQIDSVCRIALGPFRIPRNDSLHAGFLVLSDFLAAEIPATDKVFGGGCIEGLAARFWGSFGPSCFGCSDLLQDRKIGLIRRREVICGKKFCQVVAAFWCKCVFPFVAELDFGREHAAERFADWRKVVAAYPLAEFDEFGRKSGKMIQRLGNFLDFRGLRSAIRLGEDHAQHRAVAKRYDDSVADERTMAAAVHRGGYGIRKCGAQRDRERDFEIAGHVAVF